MSLASLAITYFQWLSLDNPWIILNNNNDPPPWLFLINSNYPCPLIIKSYYPWMFQSNSSYHWIILINCYYPWLFLTNSNHIATNFCCDFKALAYKWLKTIFNHVSYDKSSKNKVYKIIPCFMIFVNIISMVRRLLYFIKYTNSHWRSIILSLFFVKFIFIFSVFIHFFIE